MSGSSKPIAEPLGQPLDISTVVRVALSRRTTRSPLGITMSETLNNLGLDSLDIVEVAMDLEEWLGIRGNEVSFSPLDTVQTLTDKVQNVQHKKSELALVS